MKNIKLGLFLHSGFQKFAIFILLLFSKAAIADIQTSKTNAYSVLAPPDGVSTSKANAYSVLSPPDGVSASKVHAYGVLSPPDGVSASKVVVYAVLAPPAKKKQPSVFIMTKNFEFDPVVAGFSVTRLTDIQNYFNQER